MRVLKNGRDVPFLYGTDRLTPDQVQKAVSSMSYFGLQTAAASFFILAKAAGMIPCQMMKILEADNRSSPIRFPEELGFEENGYEIIYKRRNQWNS